MVGESSVAYKEKIKATTGEGGKMCHHSFFWGKVEACLK